MSKQTQPDAEAEAKAAAEAEAQAKAEAEAQAKAEAEAQAKAEAEAQAAAAAKSAKAPSGRKAKAAVASAKDLRAAIAQVEGGNHAHGRAALVAAMEAAGAKIADRDSATHIDWLGIKMQTTAGLPIALTTWCSKARRAIMSGDAE